MKLRQMNKSELPREKARLYGIKNLSNRELLALLIGSGTKKQNVLEVADELLLLGEGLGDLSMMSAKELMKIDGIKEAKALVISAAFELSRRIAFEQVLHKKSIESVEDVVEWLRVEIGYAKQENFIVLFLNQANEVICYRTLFVGTLTGTSVHPREIFKEAIQIGCAKIMCAHNHPSGNPQASKADIEITKALLECSKMVSIPLLDHVIVAKDRFLSFRENFTID